jgi:hypothetical protein
MSYIPPYFERGKPIEASKLNTMIDLLRQAIVQPGRGYSVTRNWGGTSLSIIDKSTATGSGGGGTAAICPFEVTDASADNLLKINVAWGVIANRIPTGMFPNDDPQLVMTIEGSVFVYAAITFDLDTLNVSGVSFVTGAEVKTNTTTTQYWLIATVTVDTTGESPVISKIMNVCQEPYASPCQLATA